MGWFFMRRVYRIGKFRFFTYEEYQRALEDVEKIRYISDEVDIEDPDAVVRLYTSIRQKQIKFNTEIGEDYLLYLSDIVADNTKNGALYKGIEDDGASKIRRIVGLICLTIAFVSFAFFAFAEYSEYKATKEMKQLQNIKKGAQTGQAAGAGQVADIGGIDITLSEIGDTTMENNKNADNNNGTDKNVEEQTEETVQEETKPEKKMLSEYQEVYAQNNELMGWIRVPGTQIDYPVMQSASSDEYYLEHDFYGNEDKNGTLFISRDNDYIDRDTNIIVYGHNMKSGLMFGELKHYLEDNFWNEHRTVEFDTLYDKGVYEIVAVCLAEVGYQDDEAFKYYQVHNIQSKNDFKSYKSNIKMLSVFGGDVDIAYGDKLLTLSTCNSYTEDGRLFLIAKKTG